MKNYKCTIRSNSTGPRVYTVHTQSALKAAAELGRCEGGEVITISTMGGRTISEARWTPEDGGKYYRSCIDPYS